MAATGVLSAVALCLTACGTSDDGPGDAAADGAPADGSTPAGWIPAAPASPSLSTETPCPDGWTEVTTEPRTCEPWPIDERCADDTFRFPGDPACAPLDTPCGADGFADDLPADGVVVYVAPAAAGVGTRADPFGTVADALARGSGAVIALSAGDHVGRVRLPASTALHGGCSASTVVTDGSAGGAVISVNAAGTALRRVTVRGAMAEGIDVGTGGGLELDRVIVEDALQFGVYADPGARVTGGRVVVRDTRIDPSSAGSGLAANGASVELDRLILERNYGFGALALYSGATFRWRRAVIRDGADAGTFRGIGMQIQDGADVELAESVLDRNAAFSIVVTDASPLRLSDVAIRETRLPSLGQTAVALQLQAGPTAHLDRVLVRDTRSRAINAVGAGTRLAARDTLIREARSAADGTWGTALEIVDGTEATLERVAIERARIGAVNAERAQLVATDVVIRETLGQESDATWGRGLDLFEGTAATLERIALEDSGATGIFAGGGASVVGRDLTIVRTAGDRGTLRSGRGLALESGATAEVVRARIEDSGDVAVAVLLEGSTLTLSDAVVEGLRGRAADGSVGYGLAVQDGGSVTLTRVEVAEYRHAGAFFGDAGPSRLTDVLVRDGSGSSSPTSGMGISAVGASLEGSGVAVQRARFAGLLAHFDANVRVTELELVDTRPAACEPSCPDAGGTALGVFQSTVALDRLDVDRAALCGLMVSDGAELAVGSGHVANSLIGACIQQPDFDIATLTAAVEFRDNDVNLDSTALPIPSPATPIDG